MKRTGLAMAMLTMAVIAVLAPPAQAQSGASITINVLRPTAGTPVPHEFMVLATVQSTYSLQTLTAQIDDRQTNLVFTRGDFQTPEGHRGNLSLWGLTKGQKALIVTATDVFGNIQQVQVPVIYDAPPVLTVLSPTVGTVGRPDFRLTATCADETACTVEAGWFNGSTTTIVASAPSVLDVQIVERRCCNFLIRARDSLGQVTQTFGGAGSSTNRHLVEIDEVPGSIMEVQPDRILFQEGPQLKIKDRGTGAVTAVPNAPNSFPEYGFLSPAGAIFVTVNSIPGGSRVFDWRGGELIDLGRPDSHHSLVVEGDYAIWSTRGEPCCAFTNVIRRDLVAGTNVVVAVDAVNDGNDVAANGDVVYAQDLGGGSVEVFRYRDGGSQQLSNDATLWSFGAVTDGIHVVYEKQTPCCVGPQTHAIAMHDGTTETILVPVSSHDPSRAHDYAAEGGWVMFTKPDAGGVPQIWTRSPAGVLAQRSPFGTESVFIDMTTAGDVLFSHGGRLHLSSPDVALPTDMGPTESNAFFDDVGQVQVPISGSLFRVSPVPFNVPAPPTGVTATAGDTTATVNWTPPADNGGSPITSSIVTAFNGGLAEKSVTVPGGSPSTTVTGLRNGQAYTFTVMAGSAHGHSAPSAASVPVTPEDPPVPFAVFRPSNGLWFFQGGATTNWGTTGDIAVAGDYNGDGAAEAGVYRPAIGVWFVQGGPAVAWGTGDDIPVPGDYDADGTTDIAIFRPASASWFFHDGGSPIVWGAPGDIPVPADYTGDGGTDLATFRPSTGQWFVYGRPVVSWGTAGDIPVPGDYNGNGSAEIAVFRPAIGVWLVKDGPTLAWGTNGDVPVQADYNGDDTTEFAVFRPSQGVWFVREGAAAAWGTNGDVPVYVPSAIQQAFL